MVVRVVTPLLPFVSSLTDNQLCPQYTLLVFIALLILLYVMAHVDNWSLAISLVAEKLIISYIHFHAGLEPGQVQEPGKDLYWF